ncbi:MAG TPA: MBL fold metallo-hydrolase [Chitinophagaceae bacterium]|nr:MBL fold metallo-hydrolase [Chitinophagaceae bacterium]
MKVSLKGVRGSHPTTGTETSYFGGNTPCVTVVKDEWLLVLDGGSGLQKVSLPGKSTKRVDILLTHLHFDHIQGLGFFSPLFDPTMDVHIWAPASANGTLHSRLSRYLSPPLFPVLIRELPCKLTLHDVANISFEIGPFAIDARYVIHPGPTVGYRIKENNAVLAYVPDHEPALGPAGILTEKKWISGFDIITEADLLLHDGQYTVQEYKSRMGWGHSSMEDTIKLATLASVKNLLLFHHDPSHNDARLHELYAELRNTKERLLPFDLAREGMDIEMG